VTSFHPIYYLITSLGENGSRPKRPVYPGNNFIIRLKESDATITNISQSLSHIMAEKTGQLA